MVAGVLAFATTGGKVSAGLVALAVVGSAAVGGIALRRPWGRTAVLAALVVLVAVGIAGLVFVWGAASPGDLRLLAWNGRASTLQGLNSSPANRGVALGTLTLLLAMSARWIGSVWLVGSRSWRERPEPWIAVGLILAAGLPVILFAQGVNETWFALTASAPLAVLTAVGVVVAWERARLGVAAAVFAGLVGLAGLGAVSYIWTDQVWESGFGRFWGPWLGFLIAGVAGALWGVLRGRGRLVGAMAVATAVVTVEASLGRATPIVGSLVGGARDGAGIRTAELAEPGLANASELDRADEDQIAAGSVETAGNQDLGEVSLRSVSSWAGAHADAAAFLRANASPSAVLVTNETESFLVPALTRMRTFVSGVPYQVLYGSTDTAEAVPERLEVNSRFIETADSNDRDLVCDEGAEWVWLASDRPVQGDLLSMGTIEFENDYVTVLRIKDCDEQ